MVRVTQIFVRKDWIEFRRPILVLTAGLLVPVLMLMFETERLDFAKGLVAGVVMAAPFVYAQSCFYTERQHGTLDFLLSLPLTRVELVLAKYGSLFSMTLFTIAVPSLVLRDPGLLFFGTAISLFLATLFMSATVISDKPWASQLPFWLVIILTLPLRGKLGLYLPALHPALIALFALALIPVIVLASACLFVRRGAG